MQVLSVESFLSQLRIGKLPGEIVLQGEKIAGEDFGGLDFMAAAFESCTFEGCSFDEATLRGVRFSQCKLIGSSFNKADLGGAAFEDTHISMCAFSGALLTEADFRTIDMSGLDFTGADLVKGNFINVIFRSARLSRIKARGAKMDGADFSDAELRDADLVEASLYDTDFSRADLTGADLRRALMVRAKFIGAVLADTNLANADTEDADFSGAQFPELDAGSQLADTIYRASRTAKETGHSVASIAQSTGATAPVDYDKLDVSSVDEGDKSIRPISPAVFPERKPKGRLVLAIVAAALIIAAVCVYHFALSEDPVIYDGDEFRGWIKGSGGGNFKARVDVDQSYDEGWHYYSLTLKPLEVEQKPSFMNSFAMADGTVKLGGNSQVEKMAQLKVLSDKSDASNFVFNCEFRLSTDLEHELIVGYITRKGERVGKFKFKRPRKGKLLLNK